MSSSDCEEDDSAKGAVQPFVNSTAGDFAGRGRVSSNSCKKHF